MTCYILLTLNPISYIIHNINTEYSVPVKVSPVKTGYTVQVIYVLPDMMSLLEMRLSGWIAINLAIHFRCLISGQGYRDCLSGKEVTEVKKLFFPIILPILFVACTRSVYKPGFELSSAIIIAAVGIVFGFLVNLMAFSGKQKDKTAE
ncbi:hypothetical protein SDC9_62952 [bioreactor metagenome]|uniref:Uncharacterized protein n=1 Tax=bioreactor metagenome TaxID=1076179 RepID=A0A644XL61_9ZZZZ